MMQKNANSTTSLEKLLRSSVPFNLTTPDDVRMAVMRVAEAAERGGASVADINLICLLSTLVWPLTGKWVSQVAVCAPAVMRAARQEDGRLRATARHALGPEEKNRIETEFEELKLKYVEEPYALSAEIARRESERQGKPVKTERVYRYLRRSGKL
jgi:hypothetical protein